MNWIIFQILLLTKLTLSLAPNEIVVLILSQHDTHHSKLANNLYGEIYNQSILIDREQLVDIHIIHQTFQNFDSWTFYTIVPKLVAQNIIRNETKWVILCEDQSYINLKILINNLSMENHTRSIYIGHPLNDKDATIIHHFAFFENPQWFQYPLWRSGVAFSAKLINELAKRVKKNKPKMDFFIDASHELSLFIWHNMKINQQNLLSTQENASEENLLPKKRSKTVAESLKLGSHRLVMTPASYFCHRKGHGCAIYPKKKNLDCKARSIESIYFAIKTCQKYHKERVPIIQMTWGQHALHKTFFSDVKDNNIPTTSISVPNTETGHCSKTISILKLVLNDIQRKNQKLKQPIEWIFLCDDDTLLSVSRVAETLGCFNETDIIYLGQRYGYRLHSKDGFNYITGGGGIVFSIPAVKKIIETCTCPSPSSPDDMIIGVCLYRHHIEPIHSPQFHQARPSDYDNKLLEIDPPVSFHKFWQTDPVQVYEKWFKQADENKAIKSNSLWNKSTKRNPNIASNIIGSNMIHNKLHIDL